MSDVKRYEGHTPGPWECLPWERDNGGTDWNVWGPKVTNHIGNPDLEGDFGSEADARLIADAPQLLAELTALRAAAAEAARALQAFVAAQNAATSQDSAEMLAKAERPGRAALASLSACGVKGDSE